MKIGIDATCWCNRRGFGRATRELITALTQTPTNVEYILFSDRQTAQTADFPKGCRVAVANTSVAAAEAASAHGRRSLRDVWAMRRLVRHERLDVMFFPAVYSYFPVGGDVPCVVTFYDVIAESLPDKVFPTWRGRMFWRLKCWLAQRRASRVITVSEASKTGLIRYFGLSSDRISVVSLAPAVRFTAVTGKPIDPGTLKRWGLAPRERYLLYVGGISPHKNLDALIEAFGMVRADSRARDVRLILVGDYAGDSFLTCYENLCALILRRGLQGAVQFPGYVPDEDLVHLYAGCQVFVLPSHLEGFGLPAVEAMICGAPVLASHRGSLPEVVGDGGDLFDPEDTPAMAKAILRVLTDDAYRDVLRQRSVARAKHFSWERSARQLSEVLREVGSGSPNRSSPVADKPAAV